MLVDPNVKSLSFHVYSSNQALRPTPVRLNIRQMDLCPGKIKSGQSTFRQNNQLPSLTYHTYATGQESREDNNV